MLPQKLFVAILLELLIYGVFYLFDRNHRQMYPRLMLVGLLVTLLVFMSLF